MPEVELPAATTGVFCDTCHTLVGVQYFPPVTLEIPEDFVIPKEKPITVRLEGCPNIPAAIHPFFHWTVIRTMS